MCLNDLIETSRKTDVSENFWGALGKDVKYVAEVFSSVIIIIKPKLRFERIEERGTRGRSFSMLDSSTIVENTMVIDRAKISPSYFLLEAIHITGTQPVNSRKEHRQSHLELRF